MTTNELDRALGDWLSAEALAPAPAGLLVRVTATTGARRPRPGCLASLRGHWVGDGEAVAGRSSRGLALGIAVALMVALLAGIAIVVGSGLLERSPAVVVPPAAWTATGALAEPRQELTATVLKTGDVLVVGGWTSDHEPTLVREAELWDHATGTFSPAGTMAVGRIGSTSTLLDNGTVLVIGGLVGRAELWDPATRRFTPAGLLPEPRRGHTATLLDDGGVLVIGGSDATGAGRASAYLWDPVTHEFSAAGTLMRARTDHTATLLTDGRVLVIGGASTLGDGASPLMSTEVWDPTTKTFSLAASMAVARYGHTATQLQDGRVLVVGGGTGYPYQAGIASAEVWDPGTETFHLSGPPRTGRHQHTATLLEGGRVLIVGGGRSSWSMFPMGMPDTEVWDPVSETFSSVAPSAHGYAGHGAALLSDGRVLVVGAYVSQQTSTCPHSDASPAPAPTRCTVRKVGMVYGSAAELFDPAAGAATP